MCVVIIGIRPGSGQTLGKKKNNQKKKHESSQRKTFNFIFLSSLIDTQLKEQSTNQKLKLPVCSSQT